MASKKALAIKAEKDRQELVDRIAALEEQVKVLTEAVNELKPVVANINIENKFDDMQKAFQSELRKMLAPTPSRATKGSTK